MRVPKDQGMVHNVAGVVGWPGSDPVSLVLGLETVSDQELDWTGLYRKKWFSAINPKEGSRETLQCLLSLIRIICS